MQIQLKEPGSGHFWVSLVKSLIRMAGGICLIMIGFDQQVQGGQMIQYAGLALVIAECLGIIEEMV